MDILGLDFWKVVDLKNPFHTLSELAVRAGLNAQSLYNARSKNRLPSTDTIIRMARVMGIDKDILLNYTYSLREPQSEFAKDIKDKLDTCSTAELNMIRRLLGLEEK